MGVRVLESRGLGFRVWSFVFGTCCELACKQ